MISGIYAIRNKVNNKIYIGSSIKVEKRFKQHRAALTRNIHDNRRLQADWNAYSEEDFEFIVILENIKNEELLDYEQLWMDYLKPEYNIFLFASNTLGRKCSETTRQKISKTLMGPTHPNRGKKFTNEHRENISKALKGKKKNPEQMKKLTQLAIQARLGRPLTEEHKRNISESNKRAKPSVLANHIDEIKYLYYSEKWTQKQIAAKFNVSVALVGWTLRKKENV